MPNFSQKNKLLLFAYIIVLFSYFSHAASVSAQTDLPTEPPPTDPPIGQVIKLDFSLPGIGSESGNLSPIHKSRDVLISFYGPDHNSSDPAVKPKATFQTKASLDIDPESPTYGKFVNPLIDLGEKVPDGDYQIEFRVPTSLPFLVKERSNDIGGRLFEIRKSINTPVEISIDDLITGDLYPLPAGDKIMDINDYNALVGCFGPKADTESCQSKSSADLDDNGIIDGTDYNILLSNFKTLLSLGLPVPTLSQSPKPTLKPVQKKAAVEPTKSKTASNNSKKTIVKNSSSGNLVQIVIVLILVAIVIGGIFIVKRIRRKGLTENEVLNDKTEKSTNDTTPDETIDKEFYVKTQTFDEANKTTVLTLTDDAGPTLGYFKGTDVKEGFAQVKGVMKKEGNKVYIDVSEIIPEAEATS